MNSEKSEHVLNNLMYNIAWLRNHYGLSKRKMAKILHIGLASLNKIERGEMPERLSTEVLFFIHDYFGISF